MKVRDMMHEGVQTASPETDVAALARQMKQFDIGAVPVVEDGRIIGIVTDRDITVRGLADGKDISALAARDVMSAEVITCRTDDKANHIVELMEDRQIRRLPVLDENDQLVGMISLGDVSHAMSRREAGGMARAVSSHHA